MSSYLDRWARPTVGSRAVSSYVLAGVAGWMAGLVLVTALGRAIHATLATQLVLAFVPAVSLLGSLALPSLGLGSPRVVFYEKALIAVLATALVLTLAGEALGPGVELATLGVGTFLAIGRLGCFSVACCHGRPSGHGVRYGWRHTAGGFPRRWVGVRLFPVQLVDAALAAVAVAIGAIVLCHPHERGAATAAYVCVYGAGRFALEFARGDTARRYWSGASEAQLSAACTALAAAVYCPTRWAIATAATLATAAATLVVARGIGLWPFLWLTSPRHLAEVDAAVTSLYGGGPPVTTREGLTLTFRAARDGTFELSLSAAQLSVRTVAAIGRQLGRSWTVAQTAPCVLSIEARVRADALVDA